MNFCPCGDWATAERVLSSPQADVITGSATQRYEGSLPATLAEARALLAKGLTVGVRHAERHDSALGQIARDFATEFLAPIDIHIYCSPGGYPGFGWHYDAEDVFVLQTLGKKEWSLRKNTVNPWPLVDTLPEDMLYEREIMPVMRCLLSAGDWLYIPAGYWHRTLSIDESISLSIGIESLSAMRVYDFLRPQLLESLLWRQRLPPAGTASQLSDGELLEQYEALFKALGSDLVKMLSVKTLPAAFLAALRKPKE